MMGSDEEREARKVAAAAILALSASQDNAELNKTFEINSVKKTNFKSKFHRQPRKNRPSFLLNPPRSYYLIPNTDIKYTYPHLLAEQINRYDFEQFAAVVKEICDPNLHVIFQYDGEKNPYGPNKLEISGIDSVIKIYTTMLMAIPDAYSNIIKDSVQVYRSDETNADNQPVDYFVKFQLIITQTRNVVVVEKPSNVAKLGPIPEFRIYKRRNSFDNAPLASTNTNFSVTDTTVTTTDSATDSATDTAVTTRSTENNSNLINNSTSSSTGESLPNTTSKQSNITVDNMTKCMSEFTLEPVTGPIVTTYQCSKYVFIVNSNNKITEIKHLFHVTNEKPAFI